MSLPFFFRENIDPGNQSVVLDEETSKHIVQVLRMKPGALLQLTNGHGHVFKAEITRDHKKSCEVRILQSFLHPPAIRKTAIAISLLKNASRFEWFLEKATELGVSEIIPLICERTVKQHFRFDRMKSICISAMLQSQQSWLPALWEPVPFLTALSSADYDRKFIAHCIDDGEKNLPGFASQTESCIIFIGPEGDFSENEIESATAHHFIPASLGSTRLRSETAGLAAAVLLKLDNMK